MALRSKCALVISSAHCIQLSCHVYNTVAVIVDSLEKVGLGCSGPDTVYLKDATQLLLNDKAVDVAQSTLPCVLSAGTSSEVECPSRFPTYSRGGKHTLAFRTKRAILGR